MPAVALIGLALLGMIAVGLRMRLQIRLTGDTGFRAPKSPVEKLTAVLLVLGVLLVLVAALQALIDRFPPTPYFDNTWSSIGGIVLFLCGACLVVVAQSNMAETWRIGVDAGEVTRLVTTGAFRFVRNPIFSGVVLAFLGIGMLNPNGLSLSGIVLMVCGLQLHVRRVEEPHLLRIHGEAYVEYASKVGRFVPGIGRLA